MNDPSVRGQRSGSKVKIEREKEHGETVQCPTPQGTYMSCRMPEMRGLHQTARPPSRDETRSVNPLVREQALVTYTRLYVLTDFYFTTCKQTNGLLLKIKKTVPTLDLF